MIRTSGASLPTLEAKRPPEELNFAALRLGVRCLLQRL
jgi:hypothetical protein